jgi:hypothetical protein
VKLRSTIAALLAAASTGSWAQAPATAVDGIPDRPDGPLSVPQVRLQLDAYARCCPPADRATVARIEVLDAGAIQKLDEGEVASDPKALYLVLHLAGGNRRNFMFFPIGAATAGDLNALIGRPACILAAP